MSLLTFYRLGSRDNLHELLGDRCLSCTVVDKRKFADHLFRILVCAVHGSHTSTVITGNRLKKSLEYLHFNMLREKFRKKLGLIRFVDIFARLDFLIVSSRRCYRQQLRKSYFLRHNAAEFIINNMDFVVLFSQIPLNDLLSKQSCSLIIERREQIDMAFPDTVAPLHEIITLLPKGHDF